MMWPRPFLPSVCKTWDAIKTHDNPIYILNGKLKDLPKEIVRSTNDPLGEKRAMKAMSFIKKWSIR